MIDALNTLEPNLLGAESGLEINAKELNTAAALAALSTRLLDAMSNIYQIHNTQVRLGQNVDITYTMAQNALNELRGKFSELEMRIADLEALTSNNNHKTQVN